MNSNFEKYSKLQWAPQQQSFLKELKQNQSLKSWKYIASVINEKFPNKNRNGKQCRERYMNYVRFNEEKPKILGWTEKDDLILFDNFLQFGAKWVQISNQMQGRSQNCLKNRFYGALRKVIRKINKIEKQKKLKYKKSIKYDSLMRILAYKTNIDESSLNFEEDQSKREFIVKLRRDLIDLAVSQEQIICVDEVLSLITRIHQFNCFSRTNNPQKKLRQNYSTSFSDPIMLPKLQHQCNLTRSMESEEDEASQSQTQQKNQNYFEGGAVAESDSCMQLINSTNLKNYYRPKCLQQEMCQMLDIKYIPRYFDYI